VKVFFEKILKMRLEKFLFCFELELGGIIIGFYHFIINCVAIIAAIIAFVLALIYGELKIETSSATKSQFLSFRRRYKSDFVDYWIGCQFAGGTVFAVHFMANDHGN
jgi:hypothetical protein